jgi:hypothetical protein
MRKVSVLVSIWSMSMAAFAQTSPSVVASDAASSDAASSDATSSDATSSITPYRLDPVPPVAKGPSGIHWRSLFGEWWLNLVMEHTERIIKEPKTRDQLSGRFFHGWINTVSMYRFDRWDDNDKFITSYLGHPAQGAVVAAIFWQNDDHVRFSEQDFHSAAYRNALLQAFAFVTFDAVQWKLGPVSEASIGHVGYPARWWDRDCKTLNIPCFPRSGMNDLVLNEVGGIAMTIGFHWLDKHLQKRIEGRLHSRALIDTTRILANPPQAMANIVRFRAPWFRDNRP